MSRKSEDIKVVTEEFVGDDSKVMTHPAFGTISVCRTQGGGQILFGSDAVHNTSVSIKLHDAQMRRGLSSDWVCQRRVLAEISMTEAQWATFVSSFGVGGGVPITHQIKRSGQLERTPSIIPLSKEEMFRDEMKKTLSSSVAGLSAAAKIIDDMLSGDTKTNKATLKDVAGQLQKAKNNIGSNVKFVGDMFDEDMEKKIEAAKIEAHAHIMNIITEKGIEALSITNKLDELE